MTLLGARVTATGVATVTRGVCLLLGQRVVAQGSQAYVSAGDLISSEPPFTPRLWAVRAGLALRW